MLSGALLIATACIVFPARLPLYSQAADQDYIAVGWLFAPIIGVWGLSAVALGLVQSPMPKRSAESYLVFVLAIVCIGLGYAAYLTVMFGSGLIASVGKGEPLFWVYFSLVLAPSLIIGISTVKYLRAKEKLVLLRSRGVRTATLLTLILVPLTYSSVLLTYMHLL